jgi:hypothetical protein
MIHNYAGYSAMATGSPTDMVMGDVIDAMSRAFTELNATALIRSDLPADQKGQAIASLVPAEAQLESLATNGRQAVLSGTMTLDTWFASAQAISDQLKGPASVIDPSVSAWLDGVIGGARDTALGPQFPWWAIALGLAGAALIGYKLLKK